MEDKVAKVTDRLRGQCSRREYCVEDVRSKALKALDGDTASAEEVVKSLVRDKYVDDLRFASAFALLLLFQILLLPPNISHFYTASSY